MEKPEPVTLKEPTEHVGDRIIVLDEQDGFGGSGHRHSLVYQLLRSGEASGSFSGKFLDGRRYTIGGDEITWFNFTPE